MLKLLGNLLKIAIYSAAYLIVIGITYKLLSIIIPYDMNEALINEKNTSLGLVVAATFLAIAIVFAAIIA